MTQANIVTALLNLRPLGSLPTNPAPNYLQPLTLFFLGLLPSDIHMSYLPLAHIFEHLAVLHCLAVGAGIGFWRGVRRSILRLALHPPFTDRIAPF